MSLEVRISGNHRSFQIGTMVNTATVAIAGRSSGAITSKKMRVSGHAVAARRVAQVLGDLLHELARMKIASGSPCAM